MTTKEKKAFLGRYQELEAEERDIREEIARWESRAQKVTASWSSAPGGRAGADKVQDGAINLVQLQKQLEEKAETLAQVRIEIERAIGTVKNDTQRRLLRLRYIKGLTWERIAMEMHYGYQWVCKLHGKALLQVEVKQAIESDTHPVL